MPRLSSIEIINSFAISLLQQNSLDDLLWDMASRIGELLVFEDCIIYLVEDGVLVQTAAFGVKNPARRDIVHRIEIEMGDGIVGTVARTGVAELVADVSLDHRYIFDEFGGKSELAVPVLFEGQILGVIDSESPLVAGFTEVDLELLQSVANIAAPRIASGKNQLLREQAEESLVLAKNEAEAANRAKSDFLASMSHELRTPMNEILGFAELGVMGADSLDRNTMSRYFKNIQSSGDRLMLLLNDLLDLSKLEAGKAEMEYESSDLFEIIEACIEEQSQPLEASALKCPMQSSLDHASCRCDPNKIFQVIANILSNAIKFSPKGGEIGFSVESIETPDLGAGYRVVVDDQGPGIGINDIDHIFDRFYQGPKQYQDYVGTGLGLAICQEIVELHQGTIWAEVNMTGGLQVIFQLPSELESP